MLLLNRRRRKTASSLIETIAVLGTMAILLCLGYSIAKGAREAARVAEAEAKLEQVAVALDLYFQKYGAYPRQGCDLVEALEPFVSDLRVFDNPFGGELTRGECLSLMYVQPSLAVLDSPSNYLTCFLKPDGSGAVALLTGGQVTRVTDLQGSPGVYGSYIASLLYWQKEAFCGDRYLGDIKYICVKSLDETGTGIAWQGTLKRQGGQATSDEHVMDFFTIGLRAEDESAAEAATFTATIHAGNRIFGLTPPNDKQDYNKDGLWSVGELIDATTTLVRDEVTNEFEPTATPIPMMSLDPNDNSADKSGGWEVRLVEDASGEIKGFELVCKFGLGVDDASKFQQLTLIDINIDGCEVEEVKSEEWGNKYYATRYSY